MERTLRRDLIIAGSGSSGGGNFHRVKINGSGEVHGDTECIELKVNGSAKLHGNIQCETASVNGSAAILGNLAAQRLRVQGHADINGDVAGKETRIQGSCKISGSLSGEEIKIEGGSSIGGDCEAEVFLAKGSFTIGGLLNAGQIDIILYGGCRVKEIGGEKINVKKPGIAHKLKRLIFSYIFRLNVDLQADVIEGDEIYLEYTNARIVRGNNVTIGPGCEIEMVEYKNHFQADTGANVKGKKQV